MSKGFMLAAAARAVAEKKTGASLARGKSKQDYETPEEFLAAVKRRYAITEFVCDLAADPAGKLAKAPQWYSIEENALVCPWYLGEGWNWLNPEFGDLAPWVEKAWNETSLGAQTLMLVPAAPGTNWWRDWVHEKAAVTFLNGRITFVGHTDPYPKDLALLAYTLVGAEKWYDIWRWKDQE